MTIGIFGKIAHINICGDTYKVLDDDRIYEFSTYAGATAAKSVIDNANRSPLSYCNLGMDGIAVIGYQYTNFQSIRVPKLPPKFISWLANKWFGVTFIKA